MSGDDLPRILWLLWLQGLEDAPPLVKRCVASWRDHNPGWEVVVLDESTIAEHLDLDERCRGNREGMTPQAFSDIVRINLLNEHGGVWVDATCFGCKPLDDWLPEYLGTGFFAFGSPGVDRPLSSWFLASRRGSRLTSRFCEEVNAYWRNHRFSRRDRGLGRNIAERVEYHLKRSRHESLQFRILFDLMRSLRVYPYFWFHYLFAGLLRRDEGCRKVWTATRDFPAEIPHRLQEGGPLGSLSDRLKREIDERRSPLYKLQWDDRLADPIRGSAQEYLLEGHPPE
jgi:hypothetical protein